MRTAALALFLIVACRGPGGEVREVTRVANGGGVPRILCVTAHPDDETTFAGTLYKTATFLDGVCDLFVITNGEGGFKYSTLGEPLYGLELTDEEVGRRHLPAIRKRELSAGCALLGVRRIHFLDQTDHRYTQDANEVLAPGAGVWDLALVRSRLAEVLERGRYDAVLTLLPTEATHGHHKAATILALEAVAAMEPAARPLVLAGRTVELDGEPPPPPPLPFGGLADFPITTPAPAPPLVFDRRATFGFQQRLDYRIVANWVIAEHKSQGTMQLYANRGDEEHYLRFAGASARAVERTEALFRDLAAPQFPSKTYGPSAGTNAVDAPARR